MAGEAKRGPPGFEGLSSERQARFRQLWQNGVNADDIAAEFKISRKTVYNWGIVCGVARCAKPSAKRVQQMAGRQLRLLARLSQAKADRTALAASKSSYVLLFAAVRHFWASLSKDERDYARVLALDKFAPDWLEHAGAARLRQAEDDLREEEAIVLGRWMIEDLAIGGEAAERVIAAMERAADDPEAQAAWREEGEALAKRMKTQAESLGRLRRRKVAKQSGKDVDLIKT